MDPIMVWEFHEAPKELRALSEHGGDEDWLAEIPSRYGDSYYIGWMEIGPFGCCDVSQHAHPSKPGWTVRIGVHA